MAHSIDFDLVRRRLAAVEGGYEHLSVLSIFAQPERKIA